MKSLQRQLQTNLSIVLVLTLLGLMLTTHLSMKSLFVDFTAPHLESEAKRLLNAFEINNAGLGKVRWRHLDPIYNEPYSGHYYAIRFKNHLGVDLTLNSPSLQGETISLKAGIKASVENKIEGPKGQKLIIWSKVFSKNGDDIAISIAEDMSTLIEGRFFYSPFIAISILGFLTILILQYLIARRLFRKLNKSRQELKAIQSGTQEKLSEDVPTEIFPLVREFNNSLSLMQQRMKRSRNSLGNLAHALKTPLSLLLQEIEKTESGMPLAKEQAERIRHLTERELKRARMAGLGNTSQRFDPREELPTLINVLKQAHRKEALQASYNIANEVTVFGDREDMMELLGNFLDNAFKWAKTEITCSVFAMGMSDGKVSQIKIIIEDDGIGGTSEELTMLTQRGTRLDETVEGHGLGLAICKDIVKLYGGSISFKHSKQLDGLSVEIILPN